MLLIILFRVHTEFWTQNSRLFPIHECISPDSRLSNSWPIETFEKTQEPSFFQGALQTYCNHRAMGTKKNYETSHSVIKCLSHRRDWIDHREKIQWSSTFCSYKKLQTLNYFSRLYLHFQDFFQVLEIKTFDTNSWLRMNPILFTVHVCTISVIFKRFKAEWPLNKYCTMLKGVYWIKAAWCFHHSLTFKTLAMFCEHLNRHSLTIFRNISKDQSHLKSVQKKLINWCSTFMHLDFNSTSCSCPVLIPILFEYFTLMALQMKQNSTLTPPPPYMKQHSSSSPKEKSRSCCPIQLSLITEVGKQNLTY